MMPVTLLRFSHPRLLNAAENSPSIRTGEKGDPVAILQMAFIDLGFAMPRSTATGRKMPDGIFGSGTEATVRIFQAQNRLTVDGIVGRQTIAVLESLIALQSQARSLANSSVLRLRPESH